MENEPFERLVPIDERRHGKILREVVRATLEEAKYPPGGDIGISYFCRAFRNTLLKGRENEPCGVLYDTMLEVIAGREDRGLLIDPYYLLRLARGVVQKQISLFAPSDSLFPYPRAYLPSDVVPEDGLNPNDRWADFLEKRLNFREFKEEMTGNVLTVRGDRQAAPELGVILTPELSQTDYIWISVGVNLGIGESKMMDLADSSTYGPIEVGRPEDIKIPGQEFIRDEEKEELVHSLLEPDRKRPLYVVGFDIIPPEPNDENYLRKVEAFTFRPEEIMSAFKEKKDGWNWDREAYIDFYRYARNRSDKVLISDQSIDVRDSLSLRQISHLIQKDIPRAISANAVLSQLERGEQERAIRALQRLFKEIDGGEIKVPTYLYVTDFVRTTRLRKGNPRKAFFDSPKNWYLPNNYYNFRTLRFDLRQENPIPEELARWFSGRGNRVWFGQAGDKELAALAG